jgi:probable HAF family extracellular repeat protein
LGQLPGGNASFAFDTSTGGGVIVGWGDSATGDQAFRWTQATGMQGMSPLIGNGPSKATSVSNDGAVIAGYIGGGDGFRWSLTDGVKILPGAVVEGMNASGSVLVGSNANAQAYHWQNDVMTLIPFLPGGFSGIAHAVSDNGIVVVGNGSSNNNANGNNAFRWTKATGISSLGDLPGGNFDSVAWAVSGTGQFIVGSSETATGPAAFIWDANHGMRELRKVLLNDYQVDPGLWTLESAVGISADGNTILGYGLDPTGRTAPWIVTLPEPATALASICGLLIFVRRRAGRQLV